MPQTEAGKAAPLRRHFSTAAACSRAMQTDGQDQGHGRLRTEVCGAD